MSDSPASVPPSILTRTTGAIGSRAAGVGLAVGVAVVATILGTLLPIVGGPVFGIVIGAGLSAALPAVRHKAFSPGLGFAGKQVLQLSIVVLGLGLSLQQVVTVSGSSLPVMLGTLAIALVGALVLGKLLGVRGNTQTLIGVGTGICGASAIAATTAVIGAAEAEVAYAIGTIFTFNIAAVILFPFIGHLLGLDAHVFGLWAGTAINDTSSVVAAAYGYSATAGAYALVVKLTRTLMLIPIVIVLSVVTARRNTRLNSEESADEAGRGVRSIPWRRVVPWFLVGFVVAAGLDSLGLVPDAWHPFLSAAGTFLITVALAGIGLSLRLSSIRQAGHRPLLLGGLLWVALAAGSLGLQALTGTL